LETPPPQATGHSLLEPHRQENIVRVVVKAELQRSKVQGPTAALRLGLEDRCKNSSVVVVAPLHCECQYECEYEAVISASCESKSKGKSKRRRQDAEQDTGRWVSICQSCNWSVYTFFGLIQRHCFFSAALSALPPANQTPSCGAQRPLARPQHGLRPSYPRTSGPISATPTRPSSSSSLSPNSILAQTRLAFHAVSPLPSRSCWGRPCPARSRAHVGGEPSRVRAGSRGG
jgi:hypothetical protein